MSKTIFSVCAIAAILVLGCDAKDRPPESGASLSNSSDKGSSIAESSKASRNIEEESKYSNRLKVLYGDQVMAVYKSANLNKTPGAQLFIAQVFAANDFPDESLPLAEVKKERFKYLSEASDSGDSTAQYLLGRAFLNGEGVIQNDLRAFEFIQKSAEQDNPTALDLLCDMYSKGVGVEIDKKKALSLGRTAIKLGFPKARACATSVQAGDDIDASMRYLDNLLKSHARFLLIGDKDLRPQLSFKNSKSPASEKAVEYLKGLAAHGSGRAQGEMSELFSEGDVVEKDLILAYAWALVAINNEPQIGWRFSRLMSVLDEITVKQKNEAQALAAAWKPGAELNRSSN